jgi:hypothetical protein
MSRRQFFLLPFYHLYRRQRRHEEAKYFNIVSCLKMLFFHPVLARGDCLRGEKRRRKTNSLGLLICLRAPPALYVSWQDEKK